MGDIAVRAQGLGKRYRLGTGVAYGRLTETMFDALRAPFRRAEKPSVSDDFWALRDVSFEVQRGEVLGIIGRNGAGKTTLLKILSRITEPTEGFAEIQGRVGTLLEVGTGFHPELTGRENVYLNGAILGMRKNDIDRRFDEIAAFADIGSFLDTPVKRYSSGMHVRLAFAVAAHLEPEVLIIDEVLAVGDFEFQKRCLGKMGSVAREGRTVLFVSHNMQAVATLTTRALLLSRGRCVELGTTDEIIDLYLAQGRRDVTFTAEPSDFEPSVTRVEVGTSAPGQRQRVGEALEVRFTVVFPEAIEGAALSVQVINSWGQPVLHLLTLDSEIPMGRIPGTYGITCRIPKSRLYLGHYRLAVHLAGGSGRKYQTLDDICPFEVFTNETRHYYWSPGTSTYVEDCLWEVRSNVTVPEEH